MWTITRRSPALLNAGDFCLAYTARLAISLKHFDKADIAAFLATAINVIRKAGATVFIAGMHDIYNSIYEAFIAFIADVAGLPHGIDASLK